MVSIKGKRMVCITDIHGRYETFMSLLEETKLDCKKDVLVICGDVIDRGPDENMVIFELEMLKQAMEDRMIWLMGNHEDDLLEGFERGYPLDPDRKDIAVRLLHQHLDDYCEFDEVIFVHGAYDPDNRFTRLIGDKRIITGGQPYSGKLFIAGHNEIDKPMYIDEYGNKTVLFDGMNLPKTGSIFFDTGWNHMLKTGTPNMTALIIIDDTISMIQVPISERDKENKEEEFFWQQMVAGIKV